MRYTCSPEAHKISDNQSLLPVGWVIISYILGHRGTIHWSTRLFTSRSMIPSAYQSRMMGLWVTIVGVASAVSSNGFVFSAHISSQEINRAFYAHFFFIIAIVVMVSALAIYGLSRWIIQREQLPPDRHQSQD